MTRRGVAGRDSRSEACRNAEHAQTCAQDSNGAAAVRVALESAVQLGRGHEVNRLAEISYLTAQGFTTEESRTR
jgi:hypothetical protein